MFAMRCLEKSQRSVSSGQTASFYHPRMRLYECEKYSLALFARSAPHPTSIRIITSLHGKLARSRSLPPPKWDRRRAKRL
ncbi:hypothetical protein PILCRDRAFT_830440, partial [Piloderma croceum F 1598]